MIAPRQSEAVQSPPRPLVNEAATLQLHLEDTLASPCRLWVRGRLLGLEKFPKEADEGKTWWEWRKKKVDPLTQWPMVQLETRVSGSLVQTEVPLLPDGRFEANLSLNLPVARRGWRVARYHASWAERQAEACGVVLEPPREARDAVVVLLPVEYTGHAGGAQHLTHWELAPHLAHSLRILEKGLHGNLPIYYLAVVPAHETYSPAELGLAVTTLGWPTGTIVPLPADRDAARSQLAVGVDRLRWLFAGRLELQVFNLEPGLVRPLTTQLQPAEDRAVVRRLINPEDDLRAPNETHGHKTVETETRAIASHVVPPPSRVVWESPLGARPTRSGLLPRFPLVFCHGMLGYSMLRLQLPKNLNYFHPLKDFLEQRGFRVLFPQVPPTSGVVIRAGLLREQILDWTNEPINLIGHSMGGLDARYMITHLGMADRVRSLTTISSPHRGSYMADWVLANFRRRVPLLLALEAFGINVDGFRDCRPAACREFNANTPDMPGIRYFSFGGDVPFSKVSPFLRRSWHLLTAAEGPNDGLVSVASARWGEYLGTIHADHYAQTPDGLFVRDGEDYDSLGFFSRLVEDLARRGL